MAHEYAKVNVAIWGDQDWKQLTRDEHWLYFLLWTHPKTNAAGVADWRPGRLASHAAQTTAHDVERIAASLQAKRFILVDHDTEEVLIRSYIKHDQRLKQPNASVTVANAYSATASLNLQRVIVHELGRLRDRQPDYKGWSVRAVQDVLSQDGEPIDSYLDPSPNSPIDPSVDPSPDPYVDPSVDHQPHPSVDHPLTETETETLTTDVVSGGRAQPTRAHQLPKDWSPTKSHFDRAKERGLNIDYEAEQFRLHAEANGRTAKQWNAAFTMWLNKSQQFQQQRAANPPQQFQTASERRYAQGMSLVEDELREFYSQPQEIER